MPRTLVLICVSLLGAFSCGRDAPPPSVLLVVLDTVRADRTSAYGYRRPTTPQLEALVESGVLFEDVTAPGCWTVPSHASLFTGEPPWVHRAHRLRPAPNASAVEAHGITVGRMRDDLPTLAERFAAAGYRTVSLASNPWLGQDLGLVRGFEAHRFFEKDPEVLAAAAQELARDERRPLFLFVNFLIAHAPYLAGPGEWAPTDATALSPETAPDWLRPYLTDDRPGVNLAHPPDGRGERGGITRAMAGELEIPREGLELLGQLYDAGVHGADYLLSRLLATWTQTYPVSIVAVTSDHGEGFGEHGLFDHHATVYPEVLQVPLVISAPGLPAGKTVRAPVSLADVYPTLLDLAGIASSPRSLARLARGDAAAPAPVAAAAWVDAHLAQAVGGRFARDWRLFRADGWALVWSGDEQELYDMRRDPGMLRDLAASEPDRARALRERAEAWFAAAPAAPAQPAELDADSLERLRALGYMVSPVRE